MKKYYDQGEIRVRTVSPVEGDLGEILGEVEVRVDERTVENILREKKAYPHRKFKLLPCGAIVV